MKIEDKKKVSVYVDDWVAQEQKPSHGYILVDQVKDQV